MRLFFFLLILVNLVFFAWAQGHFGPTDDSREPQRMAQQLQTEKLRIVPATQPSPESRKEVACKVIDGLGAVDAETLKVSASGTEIKLLPLAAPEVYLVAITELPNKAAADKKIAELTRFGVTEQNTVALPDGRREIVLGSFPTEAAASEFLQGLTKRGIKSARVETRIQPVLKTRIEIRAPAAQLLQQLPLLIAPYAEATLADCPP